MKVTSSLSRMNRMQTRNGSDERECIKTITASYGRNASFDGCIAWELALGGVCSWLISLATLDNYFATYIVDSAIS